MYICISASLSILIIISFDSVSPYSGPVMEVEAQRVFIPPLGLATGYLQQTFITAMQDLTDVNHFLRFCQPYWSPYWPSGPGVYLLMALGAKSGRGALCEYVGMVSFFIHLFILIFWSSHFTYQVHGSLQTRHVSLRGAGLGGHLVPAGQWC
jgi:hypothetical protein